MITGSEQENSVFPPMEPFGQEVYVMKDYLASLRYAGVIQNAMFPPKELIDCLLADAFIIYFPRDIVSGDFYYVYRGKKFYCVAAGDCTGHGVPGSLLSILGVAFLKELLPLQTEPKANRILNLMREKVMSALHQTGRVGETADSIDMAICIFDYKTRVMQYSGANRPLIIIGNGELRELRPDKMPIGLAPLIEEPFSNHIVSYGENDMFYLFSDGFTDQFGGPENKKFKHRRFRELLLSIARYDMSKQKKIIEKTFYS